MDKLTRGFGEPLHPGRCSLYINYRGVRCLSGPHKGDEEAGPDAGRPVKTIPPSPQLVGSAKRDLEA